MGFTLLIFSGQSIKKFLPCFPVIIACLIIATRIILKKIGAQYLKNLIILTTLNLTSFIVLIIAYSVLNISFPCLLTEEAAFGTKKNNFREGFKNKKKDKCREFSLTQSREFIYDFF